MKKNFHQHGLKVFAGYYGPHWKMFAIDMTCALVASVIDLVFPYISRSSMQTEHAQTGGLPADFRLQR